MSVTICNKWLFIKVHLSYTSTGWAKFVEYIKKSSIPLIVLSRCPPVDITWCKSTNDLVPSINAYKHKAYYGTNNVYVCVILIFFTFDAPVCFRRYQSRHSQSNLKKYWILSEFWLFMIKYAQFVLWDDFVGHVESVQGGVVHFWYILYINCFILFLFQLLVVFFIYYSIYRL